MRYKLRRANLVQLERRFATPVHVRTPPGLEIPACVLAYLSRGGKFVADRQPSTVQSVLAEVDNFERSLHKAVSFRGRHFAAHQFQKCRPTTACWNPPAHPDVSRYARMLRDQLSQYQPRARRRNEDFVDVAGRQWLRRHRDQVVVVDADKNLGDVLLPTEWVQETCRQLLAEASTPTSGQQYRQASVSIKCSLDCILTEAVWQGLLPKFVHKFILQSFHISTPGIFRIRVKIHKEPMAARPIMNMSKSWIGPLASFLVVALNPLMSQGQHTIQSSWEFQNKVEHTMLASDDGWVLCTVDIKNLYPSINHMHFLKVFAARVRQHWHHRSAYANLIIRLCELLLHAQFVMFEETIWQVTTGFATGLQTGVVFANIYLASLDDDMQNACVETASPLALCWFRYIDDGFCIVRKDCSQRVLAFLNSWHSSIRWELSAEGLQVPFLDLHIKLQDGRLSFETYRKPQNSYSYLPRSSCHAPSVFRAIVTGECVRLFRNNKDNPESFVKHVEFFVDKLGRRGYNKEEARSLIAKTVRRLQGLSPARESCQNKRVFFKQPYSFSLNSRTIKVALKRDWHVVQKIFQCKFDFMLCYRVQPNDFRRNYANTWLISTRAG